MDRRTGSGPRVACSTPTPSARSSEVPLSGALDRRLLRGRGMPRPHFHRSAADAACSQPSPSAAARCDRRSDSSCRDGNWFSGSVLSSITTTPTARHLPSPPCAHRHISPELPRGTCRRGHIGRFPSSRGVGQHRTSVGHESAVSPNSGRLSSFFSVNSASSAFKTTVSGAFVSDSTARTPQSKTPKAQQECHRFPLPA